MLDQAISNMLRAIEGLLSTFPSLPADPRISVSSVAERAVGLGNRRGTETHGSFAIASLKGLRLDALIRFQFLASNPGLVEEATTGLSQLLMANRDALWVDGFLRLALEATSPTEQVPTAFSTSAWHKQADYRVLYEHRYQDADGAESLIARIPITIDSEFGESTIVADDMVRWDDQATPALEVRGRSPHPFRVGALALLVFLPDGWDGSEVTVSTSVDGAVRERTFANVREFRDAFDIEREEEEEERLKTFELGENPYVTGRLVFPNPDFPDPITLAGGNDAFRIRYATPAFDSEAVVYLRVLR